MKNLIVFLVKVALLALVFWLTQSLMANSSLAPWAQYLIFAVVASAVDYVIDVCIKPDSKAANYLAFSRERGSRFDA